MALKERQLSNFKSKRNEGSGNELVDYSRAPCLGADQKARGLWERDCVSLGRKVLTYYFAFCHSVATFYIVNLYELARLLHCMDNSTRVYIDSAFIDKIPKL